MRLLRETGLRATSFEALGLVDVAAGIVEGETRLEIYPGWRKYEAHAGERRIEAFVLSRT